MKIALINTSRGWGGAELQMLALASELELRGHQVTVVARRGGPVQDQFSRNGHRVVSVVRKGLAAVAAPLQLVVLARRERFQIIHSHRDHDLPLAKLLALAGGVPLLLTQHCLPTKPSRLVYCLADRIVCVSEYIAAGIRERLPALTEKVAVIHSSIDVRSFSDPDPSYWRRLPLVGDRWPLLGVVGSFYKNQEELVELLPELRDVFPRVALLLIGEDEAQKPRLVEHARQLGVSDAVIFVGKIPHEQMKNALAGLDLNVSAFRNEGFGLSVVEGLAVGTPFVGYQAGGYPEIITDDRFGFLVQSPQEFARMVLKILSAGKVPEGYRQAMHADVVLRFSLKRMVDDYVSVYENLCGIK